MSTGPPLLPTQLDNSSVALSAAETLVLQQHLIAGDEAGAIQFAKNIVNAGRVENLTFVQGPAESVLAELVNRAVQKAQSEIALDASLAAFQNYFASLNSFNRSPYRFLAADFGPHSLAEIYVSVSIRQLSAGMPSVSMTQVLAEMEQSTRPILLEGSPGGGKSTLLRFLALSAWSNHQAIGLRRRHLPLLVRMQCLGSAAGAVGQRLWQALEQAKDLVFQGTPPPSDFLLQWSKLMDAPWLLLLDGWDEIHPSHLPEVAEWLRVLLSELPNSSFRIVLTTRPTQTVPRDLEGSFDRYLLELLSGPQQEELARKWLGEEAGGFLAWYRRCLPPALAGTPLLLTIAAFVFKRCRGVSLPVRRVGLYRQFIEAWINEMWQRGGEEQLEDDAKPFIELALEQVALSMTTSDDGNVSTVGRLAPRVAETLAPLLNRSAQALSVSGSGGHEGLARRVVRTLGVRSGVFQCFGDACVWMHPTFREYLTARAFARPVEEGGHGPDSAEGQGLLSKWNEDRWRQPLIMALALWSDHTDHDGLAAPTYIIDHAIMKLADAEPPRSVLFCGRTIAEGARVSRETDIEIIKRLLRIARDAALENFCARLLTPADRLLAQRVMEILGPRFDDPLLQQPLSELGRQYLVLARELNENQKQSHRIKYQTSLCVDMAGFRRWDELMTLARDEEMDIAIRLQAISKLPTRFAADLMPLLQELAQKWSTDWPERDVHLGQEIVRLGGAAAVETTVNDWHKCSSTLRSSLPKSIEDQSLLQRLAADDTLPLDLRISARLRTLQLSLMGTTEPPVIGEPQQAILDELYRMLPKEGQQQNWPEPAAQYDEGTLDLIVRTFVDLRWSAGLVAVARIPRVASELYKKALAALRELGALEEMVDLLEDLKVDGDVREQAACVLAESQDLGRPESRAIVQRLLGFLNKRLRARRGNHALLLARAKAGWAAEKPSECQADLTAIISDLERVRQALLCRARVYRFSGLPLLAVSDLDQALGIKPADIESLADRAVCHSESGNPQKAVQDFEAIENFSGSYNEAVPIYADSLRQIGRVTEAISLLDDYLHIRPKDVVGWGVRGRCDADKMAAQKLEFAIECFTRALELDPEYVWGLKNRAICQHRRGNVGAAWEDQTRLCELRPNNIDAAIYKAQLSIRTGKLDIARTTMDSIRDTGGVALGCLDAFLSFAQGQIPAGLKHIEKTKRSLLEIEDFFNSRPNTDLCLLILLSLAAGDNAGAAQQLEVLRAKPDSRIVLQDNLLPDLQDLIELKVPNTNLQSFRDNLEQTLLPSTPLTAQPSLPPLPAETRRSGVHYPCPMYCQKASISGLEAEQNEAKKALRGHEARRTIVVLGVDGAEDPLFGMCNFRKEEGDEFDFKFCEWSRMLLDQNLRILVHDFHVEDMLFKQPKVMDRFRVTVAEQALGVRCLPIES